GEDGIGVAQGFQAFPGDVAEAAHRQTRPRKRLPPDNRIWQAERRADFADFIFKEITQRLNQLELQIRREAADVVVTLDGLGDLAAGGTFDYVGINRPLRQKLHALTLQLAGGVGEGVNEQLADGFPLGFRLGHTVQRVEKIFGRVYSNELHMLLVVE